MPAAFDPVVLYTRYTKIGDFLLIWILLTLLIKWIFVRVKYATKTQKGLFGGVLMGALSSEDKKTMFSLEGLMSCILGLMMTLGGITYYNWSLKAVFTGTTFPFFVAVIVFAMSYGAAGARTKNSAIKFATALFVSGLTYGLMAYKSQAAADWPSAVIWMLLFVLMVSNLTGQVKGAGRGATAGRDAVSAASGDTKEAKKQLEKVEKDIFDVAKKTNEAEKKQGSLFQDVQKALAAVKQTLSNQLKAVSATSMLFAAALQVGSLLFSQGASADEVRNELKKRYNAANTAEVNTAEIIEAVVATLAPQVPPKQLQPAPTPASVVKTEMDRLIDLAEKEYVDEGLTAPVGLVRKATEAVIRNYVEYGILNPKPLVDLLVKYKQPQDSINSFVRWVSNAATARKPLQVEKPAQVKVIPPPAEETKLPPTASEKVRKAVTVNLPMLKAAQEELLEQISNFEDISSSLQNLPNKMRDISSIGMRVHGELDDFAKAAAVMAEQTRGMADVSTKTDQLHHDASHALNTADLENQQFKSATDPFFSILSSDAGQLVRIAQELKSKLGDVRRQLDLVEKNTARLTRAKGGLSVADVELYNTVYKRLEQLLTDIAQILEHHGDPLKTVLVSLPGTADAVEQARKVFDQLDSQIGALFERYTELFDQTQKLQSTKAEEEKAEQMKLLDEQKIYAAVKIIDQTVITNFYHTMLPKAQGAGSSLFIPITKGDVQVLQDEAQQVMNALKELDDERAKVIDMATGNAELNILAQKLADLQGLPLRKDLADFVKNKSLNGMEDNARGNSKLGRALAQMFMGLLTRTPEDTLQKILEDIKTAAGRLPKGAVRPSA